jgi:hypothetical protein
VSDRSEQPIVGLCRHRPEVPDRGLKIGDAVERVLTRLDWIADLDVDAAAETGPAVAERHEMR